MGKWKIAFVLAAAALAAPAGAWNSRGHMIVAARAWDQLDPATQSAIGRLLRHNPEYASWVRGAAAADRDRVAFIQSATWPDDIKSKQKFPGYVSDRINGPNAERNTGHDDCNRHGYWHYINIPFSPDGTPTRAAREPNIVTRIAALSAALSDSAASDEVKAYDIAWLAHLVGDIHQPLHAAARFLRDDPDGDSGGLDVKYCLQAGCAGTALHSFWDGAFGGSENLVTITSFARALPAPDPVLAAVADPAQWAQESFVLAKEQVYIAPVGPTIGTHVLTNAYRLNAERVTRDQVSLAGARLADLLDRANLRVRGDAVQRHSCPAR